MKLQLPKIGETWIFGMGRTKITEKIISYSPNTFQTTAGSNYSINNLYLWMLEINGKYRKMK